LSGNGRRSIPRLPGLPIAGNIFEYARSPIGLLLRVHRELGDTAFFRMGVFPVLSIADPGHIETILVERADAFEKGLAYRFLRTILGNRLVTASNAVQRRSRCGPRPGSRWSCGAARRRRAVTT
jgi:hypothetical protein